MTNQTPVSFMLRRKKDGSQDSICCACLAIISSHGLEADVQREQEDHVCPSSFRSVRFKRSIDTTPASVRFPPRM